MPEIVEVRKYTDLLKSHLKHSNINQIKILNGRYKTHSPFEGYNKLVNLLPLKVVNIKTKGKLLYFIFENNTYLLSTLGLTGGWTYLERNSEPIENNYEFPIHQNYIDGVPTPDYIKKSLKHLNLEFVTDEGSIFFFDTLSYGTLKYIESNEEL